MYCQIISALALQESYVMTKVSNSIKFSVQITLRSSLSDNILMCDCHLQWLVGFLDSSRATVTGTFCNGSSVPITDPSISFSDCQGM